MSGSKAFDPDIIISALLFVLSACGEERNAGSGASGTESRAAKEAESNLLSEESAAAEKIKSSSLSESSRAVGEAESGSLTGGGYAAEKDESIDEDQYNNGGASDMKFYTMTEINIKRDGMNIYGRLYMPDGGNKKLPLVILSHGFGDTYRGVDSYAVNFAGNGIAAFDFDFIGGGYGSRSDGEMTDMSVLTEARDLDAVMNYFENYDGIDHEKIILFGASQGGFVSTYVAGERLSDITGLILLYPAYVLQDDSRGRNPDPETGSNLQNIMGMTVGKIYDVDAQSFDIYDSMKKFPGKVLIIHGTSDSIVPISYSERAVGTFPDAELIKIKGAGHGYYGSDRDKAAKESLAFAEKITG